MYRPSSALMPSNLVTSVLAFDRSSTSDPANSPPVFNLPPVRQHANSRCCCPVLDCSGVTQELSQHGVYQANSLGVRPLLTVKLFLLGCKEHLCSQKHSTMSIDRPELTVLQLHAIPLTW